MRTRLFRILAVALLVLAVPLHGIAAVTAGQCMTLGHHHDAGGHDHDPHGHDGDHGKDHSKKSSHCGPCAACCASASIAGPDALHIADFTSHPEYFFTQSSPPGVQADGVYRPPLAL